MLYLHMDFKELTIDGLIDTSALTGAISEADLRKIQLVALQTILNEGLPPAFQVLVANGDLETPRAIVEPLFEVRDILFKERFIVKTSFKNPLIGLIYRQRNSNILDMR